MWMSEQDRRELTAILTAKFRSFGGGQKSDTNPIANATTDAPPAFAAGVDVREVVNTMVNCIVTDDESGVYYHHIMPIKEVVICP